MWLLPVFSAVSAAAVRAFYRLRVSGERVPARDLQDEALEAGRRARTEDELVEVSIPRLAEMLARQPLGGGDLLRRHRWRLEADTCVAERFVAAGQA